MKGNPDNFIFVVLILLLLTLEMVWDKFSIVTRFGRTIHLFPLDALNLFNADLLAILYGLAHVAGWDLHHLDDIQHVSWVGSAL